MEICHERRLNKLLRVIHGLPLYNVDFFLTHLNFNEVHKMICLADISDRTFTIIAPYDASSIKVHKVCDEIKTGLQSITKEYNNHMKGDQGVERNYLE